MFKIDPHAMRGDAHKGVLCKPQFNSAHRYDYIKIKRYPAKMSTQSCNLPFSLRAQRIYNLGGL